MEEMGGIQNGRGVHSPTPSRSTPPRLLSSHRYGISGVVRIHCVMDPPLKSKEREGSKPLSLLGSSGAGHAICPRFRDLHASAAALGWEVAAPASVAYSPSALPPAHYEWHLIHVLIPYKPRWASACWSRAQRAPKVVTRSVWAHRCCSRLPLLHTVLIPPRF